jgi:hypothetical protein
VIVREPSDFIGTLRAKERGGLPTFFASTFFVAPSRFFPRVSCNPNVVWDYEMVARRHGGWAQQVTHRLVVNDAELAKIPPFEWFVRFAERPEAPTGDGRQALYRIGRANNAAWIDASVPLWIHALGASSTPEEDEAIFAELDNFKLKENHDFQRFHARTLAIKSTNRRWENGYAKYVEWYGKAGGGATDPAPGITADLDDVLEEEEPGDAPSESGAGERQTV